MKAKVYVTPKKNVLDPQGKAVEGGLKSLGYNDVHDVRVGRYIEVSIDASSKEDAKKRLTEMCEKLLANTIIEEYRVEIEG